MEKFTKSATEVLDEARNIAIVSGSKEIESLNILLSLTLVKDSVAFQILERHEVTYD